MLFYYTSFLKVVNIIVRIGYMSKYRFSQNLSDNAEFIEKIVFFCDNFVKIRSNLTNRCYGTLLRLGEINT